MSQGQHRVVIVGGGFGGIRATRALARTDVDITIVDRTNHHLFQPLLYQVATGILPDGLIAPALRSVVRKQANARVVLAVYVWRSVRAGGDTITGGRWRAGRGGRRR